MGEYQTRFFSSRFCKILVIFTIGNSSTNLIKKLDIPDLTSEKNLYLKNTTDLELEFGVSGIFSRPWLKIYLSTILDLTFRRLTFNFYCELPKPIAVSLAIKEFQQRLVLAAK